MFGQQLNLGHWSTDGLIFYWRGIEAGNVVDESFYRNHGTITGATWEGNGLLFDGNEDFVDLGTSFLPGLFTVSIEMIFTPSSSGSIMLAEDGTTSNLNAHLLLVEDNIVKFLIHNGTLDIGNGGTTIVPGTTYHVVGTWRAGEYPKVYINGIIDTASTTGSTPTGGALQSANTNLAIGGRPANTNTPITSVTFDYAGTISTVRYYNRVLSASEIAALNINPDLPMQQEPLVWLGQAPVGGTTPKGPLGHPLYGPLAGPIAC
ncbi:hypothetical protein LCGC14_1141230 [marine sediment metagenome]|uniref:LamG-like jellyroll fold domain-containing protein n=1 Tax=marine sediment metagenome TaxID=412755 RepID=A0A0F9M316_9ZZZZ